MADAYNTKTGDTVHSSGHLRKGKVVKTKADGTRVVKTKMGTLKEMKNPKKPVEDRS